MGCGNSKEGDVRAASNAADKPAARAVVPMNKETDTVISGEGPDTPETTNASPEMHVTAVSESPALEAPPPVDPILIEFPLDAINGRTFELDEEDKEVLLPKNIKYRGKWLNGKQHGVGQFIYPDGSTYLGDFANGKPHGLGIYTIKDGSRLEGTFVEGKANGYGIYHFADGSK